MISGFNRFFLKLLLAVTLFLVSRLAYSQDMSPEMKEKVEFIYKLSEINLNESLSEAEKLYTRIDEFSTLDQTTIYLLLIDLQIAVNNLDEAIKNCKQAISLAEDHNYTYFAMTAKFYLAKAYVDSYQLEEALRVYESLSEEVGDNDASYLYSLMQVDFALLNKRFDNSRKALNILLNLVKGDSLVFQENDDQRQRLFLNIADLYNELGVKDSSEVYLRKFAKAHEQNPEVANHYKALVNGNIAFTNSDYAKAVKCYNEAFSILKYDYEITDLETLFKKSYSLFKLGRLDSVKTNLRLISEIEDFEKKLSKKNLGDYYKLNADLQKELGNESLSNSFFEKYVQAREEYNSSKFRTQEGLYDIKTKEILAESEQNEKKYKNYIIYISSILGFFLLAGISFYIIKTQKDKKRFAELMATVKAYEENRLTSDVTKKTNSIVEELPRNIEKELKKEKEEALVDETDEIKEDKEIIEGDGEDFINKTQIESSPLKDEKIQELLEKLEKLRESGYFLRQDSSLYNTAKRLKTNTSYLSSVINNTMNTNFNRFVNDIRMDYVILELKNNKRMRSYSVKGIAEEIGYKSADSFTKYFKESTGLSPSVFIRNLNKEFKI